MYYCLQCGVFQARLVVVTARSHLQRLVLDERFRMCEEGIVKSGKSLVNLVSFQFEGVRFVFAAPSSADAEVCFLVEEGELWQRQC